MKHKSMLFKASTPNARGRMYPLSTLQEMISKAEVHTIPVVINPYNEELSNIIGDVVDLELIGDEVWATYELYNVPNAEAFNTLIEAKVSDIAASFDCDTEKCINKIDGTTEYNDINLKSVFICPTKDKL